MGLAKDALTVERYICSCKTNEHFDVALRVYDLWQKKWRHLSKHNDFISMNADLLMAFDEMKRNIYGDSYFRVWW